MDQDAFRKLLSAPRPNAQSHSFNSRGSLLKTPKATETKSTDSRSEFKPRKVKKNAGSDYRDRAAERRLGQAGDFAEAEAVLETFEKQHADEDRRTVEERRHYLGGDAAHTVLVKGLDFALLEQQRAKVSATEAAENDEALEAVFNDSTVLSSTEGISTSTSSAPTTAGKKRTREELLKELKIKRAKGDVAPAPAVEADTLEEAKKAGKFMPIGSGFKPIRKTKEGKAGVGTVKKKKKRKVEETTAIAKDQQQESPSLSKEQAEKAWTEPQKSEETKAKQPMPEPEREPLPDDFNIFADVGDYDGLNLGDDDDEEISSDKEGSEGEVKEKSPRIEPMDVDERRETDSPVPAQRRKKWISDDESEPGEIASPPPDSRSRDKGKAASRSPSPSPSRENSSIPQRSPTPEPARLAPLASSALPSIRDVLAADEALEAEEKRKARKEKRKAGGGGGSGGGGKGEEKSVSKEAKLNRDYQKLKSYQEKKSKA